MYTLYCWVTWVDCFFFCFFLTLESLRSNTERDRGAEFGTNSSGSRQLSETNTFLLNQDKCCTCPHWEQRGTIFTLLRGSLHLFWVIIHIRVCFCHRDVNTFAQPMRCSSCCTLGSYHACESKGVWSGISFLIFSSKNNIRWNGNADFTSALFFVLHVVLFFLMTT